MKSHEFMSVKFQEKKNNAESRCMLGQPQKKEPRSKNFSFSFLSIVVKMSGLDFFRVTIRHNTIVVG